MNEAKLAVLDSLREFFNRVDSSSVRPIGVKDFIGWCNEPCDYYPKSSKSDSAYKLGKTICALEELSDDKIDGIRTTLKKGGLLLGYNPRAPGSRLKARARTSSRPSAS